MSTTPIWSLNARRSELGHATKGQIYLAKVTIGLLVALVLWLASMGNGQTVFLGSAAVFFTSKVCYYVNRPGELPHWPGGWDTIPDWVTDCLLHFGWLFAMHLWYREWRSVELMLACFLVCYPFSCE